MTNQDNARKLLQRLASDDAFRSQMEADPVKAFSEYGFAIDPDIAPAKANLPSKEEIEGNLDRLSRQMEATSGWVVFCR